ncbi:MAG: DNA double-strand break repair nuclease NurA [Chloroflexi bacterium]|nr:DNA double-strand break repair nuclease NurA [Chloroflexota bacterium]
MPKTCGEVALSATDICKADSIPANPIRHVVAIDGGYREVAVRREFPSSTMAFFQIGAIAFHIADLEALEARPFVDPDDMAKLKNIERFKLVIPTKNITTVTEGSLTASIRRALHDFFVKDRGGGSFAETLKWLVFCEFETPSQEWNLATCPNKSCTQHNISLKRTEMLADYRYKCPSCGEPIYLSDIFRLHEAIDDELGAGGVLGYLVTLLEQMVLVHLTRVALRTKPSLLKEIIFIKDGPLAFFGQTANMQRPMRQLCNFLLDKHDLFLAGLEKSGAFVDHADQVSTRLKDGEVLLLSNSYIYKHIIPGPEDPSKPYARTSYYGGKLIFKRRNEVYVITVPVRDEKVVLAPHKGDFRNLDVILHNIAKLHCDMYDSSLVPVALVNKLVSLADHPSAAILERFAKASLG